MGMRAPRWNGSPMVKMQERGAESLTSIELLAIVTGANKDADMDSLRTLVSEAGGVRNLVYAQADKLSPAKWRRVHAALELARRCLFEELQQRRSLTSPRDSAAYLKAQLGHLPHEVFACLFLDNRHRVIAFEQMFRGTLDGASVHPREVVRAALNHNAAAVIFGHNHPSGVAEPSAADRNITHQLRDALALIGVRVLDHLVVGAAEPTSMAARGLI